MKAKFLYIILSIMFFAQCRNDKSVDKPANLIAKNDFQKILLDVNLLEGYLTNLNVNSTNVRDESLGKYKSVLVKHEVTYAQYQESYTYYIQQEYFKDMQQEVLDSLNALDEKLKNVPEQKEMTFPEFLKLLENDAIIGAIKNDTIKGVKLVDSINRFYKQNPNKLKELDVDTLSFNKALKRLRMNNPLLKTLTKKLLDDTSSTK